VRALRGLVGVAQVDALVVVSHHVLATVKELVKALVLEDVKVHVVANVAEIAWPYAKKSVLTFACIVICIRTIINLDFIQNQKEFRNER
jgi:hypothetical protein